MGGGAASRRFPTHTGPFPPRRPISGSLFDSPSTPPPQEIPVHASLVPPSAPRSSPSPSPPLECGFSYRLRFVPRAARGSYLLHISFGSVPVEGSPFRFTVRPGAPSVEASCLKVYGRFDPSGQLVVASSPHFRLLAGERSVFTLTAVDANRNSITSGGSHVQVRVDCCSHRR